MAFGVFSLSLVAIPLGIQTRRQETMANFAIAIGLTLVYYFALSLVEWAEHKPEFRPDLLVWAPNLLTQALGISLLLRVGRG